MRLLLANIDLHVMVLRETCNVHMNNVYKTPSSNNQIFLKLAHFVWDNFPKWEFPQFPIVGGKHFEGV